MDVVVQVADVDVVRKERRNGFPSPSSVVWSVMEKSVLLKKSTSSLFQSRQV